MAKTRDLFVDHETLELRKNGVWYSNGEEVTHEETCRAFFRHLERDSDGWLIRIGGEKKRVSVEDTGHFVTGVTGDPESGFGVRLADGSEEDLDPATLRYENGRLTCRITKGEHARFVRPAYMQLLKHLQQDDEGYFVVVRGETHRLAGRDAR